MPPSSAAALTTVARCRAGRAVDRQAERRGTRRARPCPTWGRVATWNAYGHHHPDGLRNDDRQVQERERRRGRDDQTLAPRRSPCVQRYIASGGTTTSGNSLIAPPTPKAMPAVPCAMPFEGQQTDDERGDREQVPVLERVEQDGGGDRPPPHRERRSDGPGASSPSGRRPKRRPRSPGARRSGWSTPRDPVYSRNPANTGYSMGRSTYGIRHRAGSPTTRVRKRLRVGGRSLDRAQCPPSAEREERGSGDQASGRSSRELAGRMSTHRAAWS